jgi:hypothetical protein
MSKNKKNNTRLWLLDAEKNDFALNCTSQYIHLWNKHFIIVIYVIKVKVQSFKEIAVAKCAEMVTNFWVRVK